MYADKDQAIKTLSQLGFSSLKLDELLMVLKTVVSLYSSYCCCFCVKKKMPLLLNV